MLSYFLFPLYLFVFVSGSLYADLTLKPQSIRLSNESPLAVFSFKIKSDAPMDSILFSFVPDTNPDPEISIFTDNHKWLQQENGYLEADPYGNPRKRHIMEKYLEIRVAIKIRPGQKFNGNLQVSQFGKVLTRIPLELTEPFSFLDFLKTNYKNPLYVGIVLGSILVIFLIVFFIFFYTPAYKRPSAVARGRFSTLVLQGQTVKINNTSNPFGVILAGLPSMLSIEYTASEIRVMIGSKLSTFSDETESRMEINSQWEMLIEPEKFQDTGDPEKSLQVSLVPL